MRLGRAGSSSGWSWAVGDTGRVVGGGVRAGGGGKLVGCWGRVSDDKSVVLALEVLMASASCCCPRFQFFARRCSVVGAEMLAFAIMVVRVSTAVRPPPLLVTWVVLSLIAAGALLERTLPVSDVSDMTGLIRAGEAALPIFLTPAEPTGPSGRTGVVAGCRRRRVEATMLMAVGFGEIEGVSRWEEGQMRE